MFIYSAWANYELIAKSWPAGCCGSPIRRCVSPAEPFFLSLLLLLSCSTILCNFDACHSNQRQNRQTQWSPTTSAFCVCERAGRRRQPAKWRILIIPLFVLPVAFLQILMIRRINTQDIKFGTNISTMWSSRKYISALGLCLFSEA